MVAENRWQGSLYLASGIRTAVELRRRARVPIGYLSHHYDWTRKSVIDRLGDCARGTPT